MPEGEIRYRYAPVPTIARFSNSDAFIRGLMGPIGSGKSSGCVIEPIKRGQKQQRGPDGIRRTRWAVIRNTFPQLADTTIRTVHQWLPPMQFGDYTDRDHRYVIKQFEGCEIELLFRALDRPDHVANLLSLELTGGWINEAREVPWAIVDALQGRVGRYPAVRDGGCTWHGVIMDTNPPDVDSKWHNFFEEKRLKPDFAALFRQPSGLSEQAENLENLPNGRGYYEKLMQGKQPEWINVYIHGQYGFVTDGKPVFPEFNVAAHVRDELYIDPHEPIYRGWDFGLTPACVFLQPQADGRLIVFDEMVVNTIMGIDRFSDEVLTHSGRYYDGCEFIDIGDPAGNQRAQTDEKTCYQIMHGKGIWIEPGEQTLTLRLESVRKPLTRMIDGKPAFAVHSNCKTLIKALQGGYQFRRMQISGERYTDKPDKNWASHVADAIEYPCTRIYGGGLTTPKQREPSHEDMFEHEMFAQALSRDKTTGY